MRVSAVLMVSLLALLAVVVEAAAAENLMTCGPCASFGSGCRQVAECRARGCCSAALQGKAVIAKPELEKVLAAENFFKAAAAAEKLNCGPCPGLGKNCRLVAECRARGCCSAVLQEQPAPAEEIAAGVLPKAAAAKLMNCGPCASFAHCRQVAECSARGCCP